MGPVTLSIALAAASANNICLSQTPSGAGNLTIAGAAASGGVATITTGVMERQVLFTFAADESGHTFTVYGTNGQGNSISEIVAGTGTTAVTVSFFKTVTRIANSNAGAGAMTVGTNGVGGSNPYLVDVFSEVTNIGLGVDISGTYNFTVQYTYVDIFNVPDYGAVKWWDLSALASKSADTDSAITFACCAIRLKQNSFTSPGSATLTIVQGGPTQ